MAVNGVRLHYVEAGPADKPLIMFVHGFPEFWYSWRHQIRHFKKVRYQSCGSKTIFFGIRIPFFSEFWIRIWIRILLDLQKVPDPVPDPTLNIHSFTMTTNKKGFFSWHFKASFSIIKM
jgi:hypothetical protein